MENDPLVAALVRFFGGRKDASDVTRQESEHAERKRLEVEHLLDELGRNVRARRREN